MWHSEGLGFGAGLRCPKPAGRGILFFRGFGEGRRVKTPLVDVVSVLKGAFLRAGTCWVNGGSVE